MKTVHEYYGTPDHHTLPVSDGDGEYKYVVDLFEPDPGGRVVPISPHDDLMQFGNEKPPAWQTHLTDATTVESIVLAIRLFGQSSIAHRLYYLHGLPVDEPYQKPMDLESVRGFALFIMNRVYLPYPDIAANADGRVVVEWNVAGRGTLILEFLSSKYVEYLEVFQQSELATPRRYNTGVLLIDDITNTVKLWPYLR